MAELEEKEDILLLQLALGGFDASQEVVLPLVWLQQVLLGKVRAWISLEIALCTVATPSPNYNSNPPLLLLLLFGSHTTTHL